MNVRQLKELAAITAVDFVRSGMVVGLGHGTTAVFAIRRIGDLLLRGELEDILGIPCSRQAGQEAIASGIPLTTLGENPVIDLTIDGADEIDPNMNLIKGKGGALLHEKIVAQASRREIIVADDSKLSAVVGTKSPVPVEVIAFGWNPEAIYLQSLGAKVYLRKNKDGGNFITQEGNLILDCTFGPIERLDELTDWLKARAAIVESGLWVGMATDIIVAGKKGLNHLSKK